LRVCDKWFGREPTVEAIEEDFRGFIAAASLKREQAFKLKKLHSA
jgi:hypothetical protein